MTPHECSSAPDQLLDHVKRGIGDRSFEHWFHNRTTLRIDGSELLVGVGSPFLLNWMQKQFRTSLTSVASELLGPAGNVRFHVDSGISLSVEQNTDRPARPTVAVRPASASRSAQSETPRASTTRRPGRRFSDLNDFVRGSCNELALLAAEQVCLAPGERFNPLYLHGGVGTGKTHLLEGVFRRLRSEWRELQVVYLTSETFTNYFTQALRERTQPGFRQRFRTVDVLLVDDVHFLDAKRATQEEFLHTCKQLESHGRQVVVSAESHPRLLQKTGAELRTWFLSGLVCRLEAPDAETRRDIVHRKAGRMPGKFTNEALDYVARRFTDSVHELEGALNCVDTCYSMIQRRVTLADARQVLAELKRESVRVIRMCDIERTVCEFFGVAAEDLKSASRSRTVSQPRMLAMYLARTHTQAPYTEIGRYFGGRNHSTVIAAERKVRDWLQSGRTLVVASRSVGMGELIGSIEERLLAG